MIGISFGALRMDVLAGLGLAIGANAVNEQSNPPMIPQELHCESMAKVYSERNHLVAALARIFPSGIRKTDIEGWDPEWHGCVYIDLPTGQISYHFHDNEAPLFADLPPYWREWDGHDKDCVHRRLDALRWPGYVVI